MEDGTEDTPQTSGGRTGGSLQLPVLPGPDRPLLHLAVEFRDDLDVALAEHKLLAVAQSGADPPECAMIVDIPLDTIPPPNPTSSRDMIAYAQLVRTNESNQLKRYDISMTARIWWHAAQRQAQQSGPGERDAHDVQL